MSNIDFKALDEALKRFDKAIDSKPNSQLEKDGTIQRFKYTFELCWKSIRKLLLELGRSDVSSSPKPLFREAHKENLIADLDPWFKLIDARNRTSHTYNKVTAKKVFEDIQDFSTHAHYLLKKLNERLS